MEKNRSSLQERFGKILSISTQKGDNAPRISKSNSRRKSVGDPTDANSSGRTHSGKRTIRTVTNFKDLYELGKEVMPSTHKYMKVLFANRKADNHECVVKVRFKPDCFRSREDERSWRRSTEFLLNMPDNTGIASIYEVLEDSKAFYIVMEKVQGMDLFETLEHEGKVSVDNAREILRQLLAAMAHLHSHNAVHKDLKLENVMIESPKSTKTPPGASFTPTSVKVIDFDTLEEWTPSSPTSKDVVGTDQYIAQEAYAGKYSPLSDMFAVGVIGYKLLAGRFPFHDEMFDDEAGENWVGSPKMAQIRNRLKHAKVDFSHAIFRENPQACDIVMKMLAYNELHRPTAAAALEHPWFQDLSGKRAYGDWSTPKSTRTGSCRSIQEDLLDDGIIVAEESVVGDDHRQALLRI